MTWPPSPVPILSETHDVFTSRIQALCHKGKELSSLLYRTWYQKGTVLFHAPAFRHARALWHRMIQATDFSLPTLEREVSDGAALKWSLRLQDGLSVESVFIPMKAGGSLCVSSQVGCRQGCAFCETGRSGWRRNLSAQEIVAQVFVARFIRGLPIRNIVFMGMGEPLDNYDALSQAMSVLSDSKGLAFGWRHLTVSTSGQVEGIFRLLQQPLDCHLAVSLNAPEDDLRSRLMPVNRRYPLAVLYQAMKTYHDQTRRPLFITYVLLRGINDTLSHARTLAQYLKGLGAKINLIPYNSGGEACYQSPDPQVVELFKERLIQEGYATYVRLSRGASIRAGCGQLVVSQE